MSARQKVATAAAAAVLAIGALFSLSAGAAPRHVSFADTSWGTVAPHGSAASASALSASLDDTSWGT
jgi:hypothetical protein